jgi:ElaB/YqjD/DUF883 family membrane-anchored ribosome-binding protein
MPRLKRAIQNVRGRFGEGVDSAKEKFGEAQDSTVNYIKKNPIKSVLIALAAGVVVGVGIGAGVTKGVEYATRKKPFWERYF